MKKTIITTAILLSTGLLATSGIKLAHNIDNIGKTKTVLPPNTTHTTKEIASAD